MVEAALGAWRAWAIWVALEGETWHQLVEWEVSECFHSQWVEIVAEMLCHAVNTDMLLCVNAVISLKFLFVFFCVKICTGQEWASWIGSLVTATCQ